MATRRGYCYRHPNRETGVSCPSAGGAVPECLRQTPVGTKCPDHADTGPRDPLAQAAAAVRRVGHGTELPSSDRAQSASRLIYLIAVARRCSGGNSSEGLASGGMQYGPSVANGEWWRLVTSVFLHANILHLGLNMLSLGWLGNPVEESSGGALSGDLHRRGLGGAAGALLFGKYELFGTSLA